MQPPLPCIRCYQQELPFGSPLDLMNRPLELFRRPVSEQWSHLLPPLIWQGLARGCFVGTVPAVALTSSCQPTSGTISPDLARDHRYGDVIALGIGNKIAKASLIGIVSAAALSSPPST